jgi:hypothetical protein
MARSQQLSLMRDANLWHSSNFGQSIAFVLTQRLQGKSLVEDHGSVIKYLRRKTQSNVGVCRLHWAPDWRGNTQSGRFRSRTGARCRWCDAYAEVALAAVGCGGEYGGDTLRKPELAILSGERGLISDAAPHGTKIRRVALLARWGIGRCQ